MTKRLDFPFFGGCWIERPSDEEREKVAVYLPLLKDLDESIMSLEYYQDREVWDFKDAFEDLVEKDIAAWKRLKVDLPRQFTHPSGSIKSALAIHLYNPTFYVEDVTCEETDDPTNPTIKLLHDSGLPTTECLMFDQILRRSRTLDCLDFYSDDLRKPHREFVQKLRDKMWAAVEICFGKDAFVELSKSANLVRFPLWGTYKTVRLWLELNPDSTSIKRLIVEAYHPAFFSRPGRFKKQGLEFKETYGRSQDLAIWMAIQLANLSRLTNPPRYFEHHFIRGYYDRLSAEANENRLSFERDAMNAFRIAFPARYKEIEKAQRWKTAQNSTALFEELAGLGSPVPMQTHSVGSIPKEVQVIRLNRRNETLRSATNSFQDAIEDMEGYDNEEGPIKDTEGCDDEDFEDLPIKLHSWIQSQDGLKIHGSPVTTRKDLERVFVLLDMGRTYFKHFSIGDLARLVGHLFIQKITRVESSLKQIKGIPGEPGQVIHRKCFKCEKPVLDDAFPFFCAELPHFYFIDVARSHATGGNGCGQQGCEGKPALVPSNSEQRSIRRETKVIDRALKASLGANWKDPLCRTGKDLQGCANSVLVRCSGSVKGEDKACGLEKKYTTPAWTIHKPPRLVQPRLRCTHDGKDHYFVPVDKNIKLERWSNLRRLTEKFAEVGCKLADYPKIPGIIFDVGEDGNARKPKRSFKQRFQLLEEAKKSLEKAKRDLDAPSGHTGPGQADFSPRA